MKFTAFNDDILDPRTRNWTFIGTPTYPVVTCGGYLLFVYVIGPRLMKNRPAFDLRWALKLHNLFMVVANAYFCVQFLRYTLFAGYNAFCQGMTFTTDPNSMRVLELAWWFMLVRTLDFLDTVFFVLRKKFDHVTFQHVSHHFCCIVGGHLWLSLGMDGQTWFGICLNSFVHVFMHSYYFLAACGPTMKPYLWWKPYLTSVQIYQHCAVIAHGLIPLFYDCRYPRYFVYIALPQGVLGLALFLNFYAITYKGRKSFAEIFSGSPCGLSDSWDPVKFRRNEFAYKCATDQHEKVTRNCNKDD